MGQASDPVRVPCKQGAQLRKAGRRYNTIKHPMFLLEAQRPKAI
jgi:hypothetical protein